MKSNRIVFSLIILYLVVFLVVPLGVLIINAANVNNVTSLFSDKNFIQALINSIITATISALIASIIATIIVVLTRYSNVSKIFKRFINLSVILPMLLPTIAFGFSIVYLVGNNGVFTRILSTQIIDVYGVNGVILAFIIYVLGPVYLIINNGYNYLDGKLYYVSKIYSNTRFDIIKNVLYPNLKNTYISAFFISFVLAFTDYGIPMSLNYLTASKYLYTSTLGALPDFNKGALVALVLLLIPLISYIIIQFVNRKSYQNENISIMPIKLSNKAKLILQIVLVPCLLFIISNMIIILIIPFINSWPYDLSFNFQSILHVIDAYEVMNVTIFTLKFALISVIFGTTLTFISAYYVARSNIKNRKILDYLSILSNLVPGMSLGLSYLLVTKSFELNIALFLMITSNMVHYFASPYLLYKNALERLNPNLEKIVYVFGYSKYEQIFKVILPNIKKTIIEVVYYLFVTSMTTLSAIIFLASYNSITLSITIKNLQARNDFKGIFVVALIILIINLAATAIKQVYVKKYSE